MSELSFPSLLIWVLDFAFAGAGLFNLVAPTRGRWSFPVRFRFVAGFTLVLAAILLAAPIFRLAGALLGAFILFAMVVKLLDRRAYVDAFIGIALLGAIWVRLLMGPL